MTLQEDLKEACRACIDVKSWFKANAPKMTATATIASSLIYNDPQASEPTHHRTSSQGLLCPPDARELGRSTWTLLHTTVAYLPRDQLSPEKRGHVSGLLSALAVLYPCRNCAEHMAVYMETNPPDLSTGQSIARWLCAFHNEISEMLGKDRFDCNRVNERWRAGPSDDSCS
jgi:FAD-linked sulfhydryl oxidase